MKAQTIILSRRHVLSIAIATTICSFPALSASDLETGRFRAEVLAVLKRERPQLQLSTSNDPTEIVFGGNSKLFLGNLFRVLDAKTGAERNKQIVDFVTGALAGVNDKGADKPFEFVQPKLRPRIVNVGYQKQLLAGGIELAMLPLSRETRAALVYDGEKTEQYVTTKHLAAWALPFAQVHLAAIANLDTQSRAVPISAASTVGVAGKYAALTIRDSYAAARLLAPSFMARMRDALGPTIFVAVPNRDFLIAWTPDWGKRQGFAANVANDAKSQAYILTDELFVSSADGIRLATPQELADHGRR